jgi:hypothetical protein
MDVNLDLRSISVDLSLNGGFHMKSRFAIVFAGAVTAAAVRPLPEQSSLVGCGLAALMGLVYILCQRNRLAL